MLGLHRAARACLPGCRSFAEAQQEVHAWMHAGLDARAPSMQQQRGGPGLALPRGDEFLVLYLDNQADLARWGLAEELFRQASPAVRMHVVYVHVYFPAYTRKCMNLWLGEFRLPHNAPRAHPARSCQEVPCCSLRLARHVLASHAHTHLQPFATDTHDVG